MTTKNLSKSFKFDKYLIILGGISILFLASVVRYALRTYQIPEWDEQHYMRMATEFYRLVKAPSLSTPYDMLQVVPFRQPGYPLFILPFLLAFGLSNSYFWALLTNGFFYIATIFGIYFVAKNYLSRLASFMAAFIFAFYGWTLFYVHQALSETALSALCIWAVFFLIKSDSFRKSNYALLFGLFLGLGLLTRWVALIFVLGPILFVFYDVVKKRLFRKSVTIINLFLSFFIALAVAIYPYYANISLMFNYFTSHRAGGPIAQALPESETTLFSIHSLTFYITSFEKLGILYFLMLTAGIIFAIKRPSKLKLILAAVEIPWVLFSFLSILKSERFIVPIFPYLATLSASVFDQIKDKKYKVALIIITITLSIGTFFGSVWGRGPMKANLYALPIKLIPGQQLDVHLTTVARPPNIYKRSGREIIDFIIKDSRESGINSPKIVSLFYYRPLDEPLMVYNLYTQEKPLNINNYLGTIVSDPDQEAAGLVGSVLNDTDYILTKSGQKTDTYFSKENYKTLKALVSLFDDYINIKDYYDERTKIWIYQDSSEVTIYKRQTKIPEEEINKLAENLAQILKSE